MIIFLVTQLLAFASTAHSKQLLKSDDIRFGRFLPGVFTDVNTHCRLRHCCCLDGPAHVSHELSGDVSAVRIVARFRGACPRQLERVSSLVYFDSDEEEKQFAYIRVPSESGEADIEIPVDLWHGVLELHKVPSASFHRHHHHKHFEHHHGHCRVRAENTALKHWVGFWQADGQCDHSKCCCGTGIAALTRSSTNDTAEYIFSSRTLGGPHCRDSEEVSIRMEVQDRHLSSGHAALPGKEAQSEVPVRLHMQDDILSISTLQGECRQSFIRTRSPWNGKWVPSWHLPASDPRRTPPLCDPSVCCCQHSRHTLLQDTCVHGVDDDDDLSDGCSGHFDYTGTATVHGKCGGTQLQPTPVKVELEMSALSYKADGQILDTSGTSLGVQVQARLDPDSSDTMRVSSSDAPAKCTQRSARERNDLRSRWQGHYFVLGNKHPDDMHRYLPGEQQQTDWEKKAHQLGEFHRCDEFLCCCVSGDVLVWEGARPARVHVSMRMAGRCLEDDQMHPFGGASDGDRHHRVYSDTINVYEETDAFMSHGVHLRLLRHDGGATLKVFTRGDCVSVASLYGHAFPDLRDVFDDDNSDRRDSRHGGVLITLFWGCVFTGLLASLMALVWRCRDPSFSWRQKARMWYFRFRYRNASSGIDMEERNNIVSMIPLHHSDNPVRVGEESPSLEFPSTSTDDHINLSTSLMRHDYQLMHDADADSAEL
ncbi:MAG: hypothetical protein MHM6MM_003524 [Cercozoa sp. M6MM]